MSQELDISVLDLVKEKVFYPYEELQSKLELISDADMYFNRHLNRGCLIYMFCLRFSGSKFLINLRRQFRERKFFFVYVKFFIHKNLLDSQSFDFVCCSFMKTCLLTGC